MAIVVPNIPELTWLNDVVGNAVIEDDGSLKLTTGSRTDWFNPPPDPSSPEGLSNAPALMFSAPDNDWQLSAKVMVNHQYLFDAGTIFVHQGPNDWCKLCFEYSPEKLPLIVSVVTREISDDANGPPIEGNSVNLRVSKYGAVMAFHFSVDGKYWTLHRAFSLRNPNDPMKLGFLAQAPTGESCIAQFSNIQFARSSLVNLRDGS
jgi:regulation of enolase protein 1 (concanavalin A-like superfamily)